MDANTPAMQKACTPTGHYANSLRVGYNAYEFVFDFGQAFGEEGCISGCTRIITSPGHAKAMIAALQNALEAFEAEFGDIGSERQHAAEGSQANNAENE
jgi:hypothetical protein